MKSNLRILTSLRPQIVVVEPHSELEFLRVPDGSLLKSVLRIKNVSKGSIAYKIKTTAPKYYVVKPNQGILDEASDISVDIQLNPHPVRIPT